MGKGGATLSQVIQLDLYERGMAGRTAAYLLPGERPILIESGGSKAVPHILAGLAEAGVRPEEVAYLLVTHVHIDHAGGAAFLLNHHLPTAQLVVHSRGARHLIDPSRLVAGADAVYGGQLEAWYGPVEAAPAERVLALDDGARLALGGGRELICLDSPGHAKHHLAFWLPQDGLLFSGDAMGVRYPELSHEREYYLPSAPPNQFDPEATAATAQRLAALIGEGTVYPTHFGAYRTPAKVVAERLGRVAHDFARVAAGLTAEDDWPEAERRLAAYVQADLAHAGGTWTPATERELSTDLFINAKGLVDYNQRRTRN